MAETDRVVIRFCFKAGLSATETLVLVQKAYGDEVLNRSDVFTWYSQFRDGRELVEDKRDDRPKSTRNEVNIADVIDLAKNDRRIASRMITESLNISKTVVLRILKEDLGKRKLCARFISPLLDTRAKRRSSHILPRHYRDGRCKHFFLKLLREMSPGVLPVTPKQSDRVLNGLVRHPLGRRN